MSLSADGTVTGIIRWLKTDWRAGAAASQFTVAEKQPLPFGARDGYLITDDMS